jgi:serine/threonine protein phosphatase PrpC
MTTGPSPSRKPDDDELDVHGLTHVGRVRKTNQDQFLLASIHKRVQVLATSLPTGAQLPLADERLAFIAMVADGVGGLAAGEQASATALETVMRYVTESMDCYYRSDSSAERFTAELEEAARRAHEAVVARSQQPDGPGRMATTLTLFMGVWPIYYLLQVGDSRYYLYRNGVLTQVSRDQTIAQDLVDRGVMSRTEAHSTRLASILSSSIGGEETEPVVTRLNSEWGTAHLMCSDGLNKHVTDERIAERLAAMTSAKSCCEQLLQDALDDGGSDNITIIIGRTVPKPGR